MVSEEKSGGKERVGEVREERMGGKR